MTEDQQKAREFLNNYFASCQRNRTSFAALLGNAGTGKTWLLGDWLKGLLKERPNLNIIAGAPTNKAVDVLRSKMPDLPIGFRTLDSFLGYGIKRNDDREVVRHMRDNGAGTGVDLVVMDEGSMIKKEYHTELGRRRVPVLYSGDPFQLEPVGEPLSEALGVDSITMRQPCRQAEGNPILDLAQYLRDRIEDKGLFTLQDVRRFATPEDRRITFVNQGKVREWALTALDKGMDARILAFTNVVVDEHNAAMHHMRFPDAPLFAPGELALVNEAFDYSDDIKLLNGELLRVSSCEYDGQEAGLDVYRVYAKRLANNMEVNGATSGDDLELRVAGDAVAMLRTHRQLTDDIYAHRRAGDMAAAERLFNIRRPLNKLAPLKHSYATTVHKSQGSTYDIAFVDFPDIYKSREMRARLMYVAATRPAKFLILSHTGA